MGQDPLLLSNGIHLKSLIESLVKALTVLPLTGFHMRNLHQRERMQKGLMAVEAQVEFVEVMLMPLIMLLERKTS